MCDFQVHMRAKKQDGKAEHNLGYHVFHLHVTQNLMGKIKITTFLAISFKCQTCRRLDGR